MDNKKDESLAEITAMVQKIDQEVKERKTQLAPEI